MNFYYSRPPFPFNDNDLMFFGRPKSINREDYLKLLISTGVATAEEQNEYISIVRSSVENYWNTFKLKFQEELNKEISKNEKAAIKLRAAGQFEYAVKREEYIELIKSTNDTAPYINFKGFPSGWGSEFINE